LWQNRFYSCPLDGARFLAAVAYVERNPVRAGIVRKPWRYEWSSAAVHCGKVGDSGLLDMSAWRGTVNEDGWLKVLARKQDNAAVEEVKSFTRRGRPLGSGKFIAKVEKLVGRRVRALPVGRPRKKDGEEKGD
ncbi:transposase, partial [Candidatus Hydrogenedentota bacterium]